MRNGLRSQFDMAGKTSQIREKVYELMKERIATKNDPQGQGDGPQEHLELQERAIRAEWKMEYRSGLLAAQGAVEMAARMADSARLPEIQREVVRACLAKDLVDAAAPLMARTARVLQEQELEADCLFDDAHALIVKDAHEEVRILEDKARQRFSSLPRKRSFTEMVGTDQLREARQEVMRIEALSSQEVAVEQTSAAREARSIVEARSRKAAELQKFQEYRLWARRWLDAQEDLDTNPDPADQPGPSS
jgi:hypothetical protein